jgi:hypothetical protein
LQDREGLDERRAASGRSPALGAQAGGLGLVILWTCDDFCVDFVKNVWYWGDFCCDFVNMWLWFMWWFL